MIINGKQHPDFLEGTVIDVLSRLNLDVAKVVVEVNGEIISKSMYDTYWMDKAAQVEIVSFVGGG